MLKLKNENYFSKEANLEYMSSSQFKAFKHCEAAALAEITGEYIRPKTTALLVGGYVDAHFEGTLDLFTAQHPELFKRDGSLKAEYNQANQIIARCEEDELFMMLMAGKKQVIRTGEISGVPYKIKIDSLLDAVQTKAITDKFPETLPYLGMLDGLIVDGKIMRDMAPVWVEGEGRVPFWEAWGYDIQGAIYQEIEGNMLPFVLTVATKETVPDIAAVVLPDDTLQVAMDDVAEWSPHYNDIKLGKAEPVRCEHCDYCKATKRLTTFIDCWEVAGVD